MKNRYPRYSLGLLSGLLVILNGPVITGAVPEASETGPKTQAKIEPSGAAMIWGGIEIKVGNEIITTLDIEEPLRQLRKHFASELRGTELEKKMRQTREQHIKRLVESKLLLLEAYLQEVEIRDTMVEEQAEKEIESLRAQFSSSREFEKQLSREHLTRNELRKQREQIVRENLLRQRLIQMKLQEFKTGTDIADKELKQYYTRNPDEFQRLSRANLSQIYVAHPDLKRNSAAYKQQDEQARAKIKRAWGEIKQGRDFGAVARSYSEHQATAKKGGELGWIEEGDTGLPEFDRVVFKQLQVNDVSEVIDTARGYFIVRLEDRQAGGVVPFEEIRGRIRQKLMAESAEQRYQNWIKTLKQKFKVTYAKKIGK
ncbi:peptidylprolyl isomerase [bacterium]|nr:peptidylprolyl isomerase [bacterium]